MSAIQGFLIIILKSMEKRSGLSELSVITGVGVPLYTQCLMATRLSTPSHLSVEKNQVILY